MRYIENNIIISEKDLVGDLSDFPLEIVCRMVYNAVLEGNSYDKSKKAFADSAVVSKYNGGFNWDRSSEGFDFWNSVIISEDFKNYFNKYPKCKGEYIIEESDNFVWVKPEMPYEVIQLAIRNAVIQNKRNKLREGTLIECFNWAKTPQGEQFWNNINQGDYSVFTSSIKTDKNEIKLQRKESTVIRGAVPEGCILCGKKGKSSIAVGPLSFRKCIGH